jgi:CubicO group peptidase (beta-lactamase class C family)
MIRNRATIVVVSLLAVVEASLVAQEPLPVERIDSVFSAINRSDRPGCSMAIFEDGETVYAKGYGMGNLEYGIALSPRSVFHIASISKQFAAFAVELLVDDGSVSWDDDIRTYVPEIPDYGSPITLRHLVHHTSGIRDQWNLLNMAGWRWQADLVTQRDAIDLMSRQRALNFDPGEEYLYSNSGVTLLAVVVERVSGMSLREFTHQRIFEPLGMHSTHFHDDHETIVQDRAYGYRHTEEEGWKISIPDFAIVGASSLFTTVEDMEKWNRNFSEHTVGDDATFERLLTKGILTSGEEINYAHGISVSEYRGLETIGHGGADAGYRSHYLKFPEQDVGIVCFCNYAAANPGSYVRQVADVVLEEELAPAAEEAPMPAVGLDWWGELFEEISGFYQDARTDVPLYVFVQERQALITRGGAIPDGGEPLIPLGASRFQVGVAGDTVVVEMSNGRPTVLVRDERNYTYVGTTVTQVDRDAYVGTYVSDELGTEYWFEADSGEVNLLLKHRKHDPESLSPGYRDAFFTGGDWLVFTRGRNGHVTGFTWSSGRVRKVAFRKR